MLMDVMAQLGYPVIVAHLNHMIRSESGCEATQVAILAAERNLPFVNREVDVPAYAKKHGLSIEAAGREIRYTFLFELAHAREAQAVALGHTADDQVETILLHLLRGTGLNGLRGMEFLSLPNSWSQTTSLVRPLLGIWRAEVLAYLAARNLQPQEDASNLDVAYLRNRVRHELIPDLETYNPGVRRALWRMGEIVKSEFFIVEQVIDQAWENCLDQASSTSLSFRLADFRSQSQAVQRHLLSCGLRHLRPAKPDLEFTLLERGVLFANQAQPGSQTELAQGLRLGVEIGKLWLADWEAEPQIGQDWPQLAASQVAELELPGRVELAQNWVVEAAGPVVISDHREQVHNNPDPYEIWVDAERLELPLFLRGRTKGDWISPLGMQGHTIKISDLMINLKIPRRARQNWPVLCDQNGVIWVPGLRMSCRVQVGSLTKWVIRIRLHKSPFERQ